MFVSTAASLSYLPRPRLERVLTDALIGPSRVVVLKGAARSGKTSLVRRVLPELKNHFAGFITHHAVHGPRFAAATEDFLRSMPSAEAPTLLIVEDAEPTDGNWLIPLIQKYTPIKLLLVARAGVPTRLMGEVFPQLDKVPTEYVHVPNLSIAEFDELATLLMPLGLDRRVMEGLFVHSMGNPSLLASFASFVSSPSGEPVQKALSLLRAIDSPTLLGPDGAPISVWSPQARPVIASVRAISDELIAALARSPQLLYSMVPRKFEELVAELMEREGYQVTLTQQTRDGGRDVIAVRKDAFCSQMLLVECKRYASDNPVGIAIVQRLAGVVHGERAHAGIIATTSRFTPDARKCQEEQFERLISLRDYMHVHQWLKKAANVEQGDGKN